MYEDLCALRSIPRLLWLRSGGLSPAGCFLGFHVRGLLTGFRSWGTLEGNRRMGIPEGSSLFLCPGWRLHRGCVFSQWPHQ